jgi:integration host factor subunit beta
MEFQELVTVIADQTSYTRREIRQILRLLAQIVGDAVEEGRDVHMCDLGTFRNLEAGARVGRHPRTGARIDIPARRRLKFEPEIMLRNRIRASKIFKEVPLEKRYGVPKERSLTERYGLPKKGKRHGKIRSRD